MNAERFGRKLISSERIWLAMEKDWVSINFVYIIEGIGRIKLADIQVALALLCDIYPICCSKIVKKRGALYWEQTRNIPQCIDLGESEFGIWPSIKEEYIFCSHFDLKLEPPLKVFLLSNENNKRIYFKVHHTSMDGLGWHIVMEDFFRLLNRQTPVGPSEGPETRYELYEAVLEKDFFEKRNENITQLNKSLPPEPDKKKGSALLGGVYVGEHLIATPSKYKQAHWVSYLIPPEKMPKKKINGMFLTLLSEVLLEINPMITNRKILAIVPVDIRYLMQGLRKASNLTGAVGIQLDKYLGLPLNERILAINDDIRNKVNQGMALSKHPPIADKMPVSVVALFFALFNRIQYLRRKTPCYFYFSNIGKLSLEQFSTSDFKAQRIISLPILQPYNPFIVLFNTHEKGTELTIMTNADKADLEWFAERFLKKLEKVQENN